MAKSICHKSSFGVHVANVGVCLGSGVLPLHAFAYRGYTFVGILPRRHSRITEQRCRCPPPSGCSSNCPPLAVSALSHPERPRPKAPREDALVACRPSVTYQPGDFRRGSTQFQQTLAIFAADGNGDGDLFPSCPLGHTPLLP